MSFNIVRFLHNGTKTENIRGDLKGSNLLPEPSLASCKWHIWVAQSMLWCLESLKFVHNEVCKVFGTVHLDDKTIAASGNSKTVLFFQSAYHYSTSRIKQEKGSFNGFYKARAQYVSVLLAHFSRLRSHKLPLFASSWFNVFMSFTIMLSTSLEPRVTISNFFANGMRLFRWFEGCCMEEF